MQRKKGQIPHMDRIKAIERKIAKIKKTLVEIGNMRPGSLSLQPRKWGGSYGQLSYTHQGKGHTEYVPEERCKEVRRQIANYCKFRKLTQEWINLELEACQFKRKQLDTS